MKPKRTNEHHLRLYWILFLPPETGSIFLMVRWQVEQQLFDRESRLLSLSQEYIHYAGWEASRKGPLSPIQNHSSSEKKPCLVKPCLVLPALQKQTGNEPPRDRNIVSGFQCSMWRMFFSYNCFNFSRWLYLYIYFSGVLVSPKIK